MNDLPERSIQEYPVMTTQGFSLGDAALDRP